MAICSKEHYLGCGGTALVQMTDCTHRECRDYQSQHMFIAKESRGQDNRNASLGIACSGAKHSVDGACLRRADWLPLTGDELDGIFKVVVISPQGPTQIATGNQRRNSSTHSAITNPASAPLVPDFPVLSWMIRPRVCLANNCNVYNGGSIMFRSCLSFPSFARRSIPSCHSHTLHVIHSLSLSLDFV